MLFNSLLFLFFFLIVTSGYYLLPHKARWVWMLAASCYFYMYFRPQYILIILFTIVVDYVAGLLIEASAGWKRRLWLLLSLATNIGVLAFYKYYNFFAENINLLFPQAWQHRLPLLDFILPIGLSFHTFQAMSYTIEVYRGKQRAERHFGIYALYVMFYPQMVAGPIERPQHILPQLHRRVNFNRGKFAAGLFLIISGLFKKMVVADRLGLYVDPVFSNPHAHSAADLLLATYFFAFQIYCDFSGYSDIAIGAGLTLGITLMKNFNMPYLAKNIGEFWQRWHISLSTWFRDYLYIPLGGNRVSFGVTCMNLLVVFLVSGLWHGANWKYLIWGFLHACLLIAYHLLKKAGIIIKGFVWLKWLLTFNLVCLTWIFFRAETVRDSLYITGKILSFKGSSYTAEGIMPRTELYYCILLIAGLLAGERYLDAHPGFSTRGKLITAIVLIITGYFFGIFTEAQFIYFQF